ncbi:DUF4124 domain-containing protein [uncultured Psychrobacter sp.]|uniref:DUF4124 domain-containing protein n=1 Tax=uncultured Psychrobacter sp. TaxID=259303 RepID=UPI003458C6FD
MISSIKTIRLDKVNNKLVGLLTGLTITIAGFYAPMLKAAPIYKVVDEQTGQVTFTDRPQSYEQEADKQVVQTNIMTGSNSIGSSNNTSNQSSNDQQTNVKATTDSTEKNSQVSYQLTILEPSDSRAYHRPAQSIDVNLQLQPELQAGDSVSIYLNGNEIARGLSASIATVDLVPGQYTIQAIVKDEKGQAVQQVQRKVFVIQNTVSMRNKRKAAAQLQAYQNLPWHRKVLLKLRQNDIAKP